MDRIASTTQFNKQNLLDGSFQSKNLQVGANSDQKISITIGEMNSKALGLHTIAGTTTQTQSGKKVTGFTFGQYSTKVDSTKAWASQKGDAIKALKSAVDKAADSTAYVKQVDTNSGSVYYIDANNKHYSAASAAMKADVSALKGKISKELKGNNAANYADTVAVNADKNTVGQAVTLTDPSVKDYASANATIDAVQKAINQVSSQRSALGALQNRLEHTVSNLDNVSENTSSAESRIRDTDMASEMVTYSKNNILAQAGQSMLAQANQSTQGVLSLLQ